MKGRPTKLTPQRQEELLKNFRLGCYREVAAQAAGIAVATLYGWLSRGKEARNARESGAFVKKSERVYLDFLEAVEKAEALAESRMLATVQAKAPKDWKAAAWFLERRYPERYARVERHRISGDADNDEPVKYLVYMPGKAESADEWQEQALQHKDD